MSLLGALLVAYGALGLIALRPVIGHLAYEFGPMSYGGPAEPEWTAGVVLGVILCGLWPAALVGGALFLLVRPFRVGAERRARKEQERKVEESRIGAARARTRGQACVGSGESLRPRQRGGGPLMERTNSDVLTCPNPFCDGYGNIDISPSIIGRAWALQNCWLGPHPPEPAGYRPKSRPNMQQRAERESARAYQ
jgi:hypothetical protein